MKIEPRFRAISSMAIFILGCYAFFLLFTYNFLMSKNPSYFYYFIIPLLGIFTLILSIRLFINYKVITVIKGKIEVRKRFLFTKKIFDINELIDMQEQKVTALKMPYRLLNLRFPNGFLEISEQEYTNYDGLKNYVEKNQPKKKKK